MTRKLYKFIIEICMAFLCSVSFVFAQQDLTSAQVHDGSVTSLVPCENSKVFLSAGSDGHVIKWSQDKMEEQYQISKSPLLKILVSPKNNDFVTTESDSFGIFKLTVSDLSNFSQKYSKR